jgi:hypothetical protein
MAKFELPIYAAAFLSIHCFFKLASFFAAIRGEPSGRLISFAWLGASFATVCLSGLLVLGWIGEMERARPRVSDERKPMKCGYVYASACETPEGAEIVFDFEQNKNSCISMSWAPAPVAQAEDAETLKQIYVTVGFDALKTSALTRVVDLKDDGWADMRLQRSEIPEGARVCKISWEAEKSPSWRKFVPLRPVVNSGLKVFLSGPFVHEERPEKDDASEVAPNILMVVVEGLGANHVSGLGYKKAVTPALDRFAKNAQVFTDAYTPAPESMAACMTLLTGMNPLRHGYLGEHEGPLSSDLDTITEVLSRNNYATAAFTEGEDENLRDLRYGSGFERGFEIFDAGYDSGDGDDSKKGSGSAATLKKAAQWIKENPTRKYFVFARVHELRELLDPRWSERYAKGNPASPAPSSVDVYDRVVTYLDSALGDLIEQARSAPGGKNTCVVVTSSYGLDFSRSNSSLPITGLTEDCLRIPLVMDAPDSGKKENVNTVALEDVAPTLLTLARTGFDYVANGKDLFKNFENRSPISMYGTPLALSVRIDRWRLTWQSGVPAFTSPTAGSGYVVELLDLGNSRKRGLAVNVMSKHPDFVTRCRAHLISFLEENAKMNKS